LNAFFAHLIIFHSPYGEPDGFEVEIKAAGLVAHHLQALGFGQEAVNFPSLCTAGDVVRGTLKVGKETAK